MASAGRPARTYASTRSAPTVQGVIAGLAGVEARVLQQAHGGLAVAARERRGAEHPGRPVGPHVPERDVELPRAVDESGDLLMATAIRRDISRLEPAPGDHMRLSRVLAHARRVRPQRSGRIELAQRVVVLREQLARVGDRSLGSLLLRGVQCPRGERAGGAVLAEPAVAVGRIGEHERLRARGELDRAPQVRFGRVEPLADRQRGARRRAQPRVSVDAGRAGDTRCARRRLAHELGPPAEVARKHRAGHHVGGVSSVVALHAQRRCDEDFACRERIAAEVHQAAEQVLGVRAQQRVVRLRERARQELLGARSAAGAPERVRRGDRALDTPFGCRCQLSGALERPCGDGVAAACARPLCHRREIGGDVLVGAGGAGGAVPGAPVGLPVTAQALR